MDDEGRARIAAQAVQVALLHSALAACALFLSQDSGQTYDGIKAQITAALNSGEPDCKTFLPIVRQVLDDCVGNHPEWFEAGEALRQLNVLEGRSA